jgi:class 3 adenylate cyclase/CheY-like chemotaxis protein
MANTARIAIVDDLPQWLQIFSLILRAQGYGDVTAFASGIDFLEFYARDENPAPDLVFLDIVLPMKDGVEILEEALTQPKFAATLFVSLSGFTAKKDDYWLGYLGFDGQLTKPAHAREIKELIDSLLQDKAKSLGKRKPYENLLRAIHELTKLRLRSAVLENDYIKKLISPEVFQILDTNPKELSPKQRDVAVGFVDIRNFVQIMNRTQIQHIDEILTLFFTLATNCILEKHGFIDKFVGDSVMWFHTADTPEQSARQCLETAIAIMRGIKKTNKAVQKRLHLKIPIEVGIGVASGTCAVGIFGAPQHRIQYSVLGPPVNLASRLCSDASPGEILLGGGIIEYCTYRTKQIGFRAIKGFDHEVELRSLIIPQSRRKRPDKSSIPA